MRDAALGLATGFACGAVFALLGLPIPAPPRLAGICGIVGITLAFLAVHHFRKGT